LHNYHTDLIWLFDIVLACAIILLGATILVYDVIKEYSARKRNSRLLGLKRNIYRFIAGGEKVDAGASIFAHVTPQEFLDVEINRIREAIFFNESEQALFKKYFVAPENIATVAHIAKNSRNKWRRIEAILSLGYAGASVLDILKVSLYNKDEDVSYFSIVALGQIKTIQSARILLDFLQKNTFGRYKITSILETFPPAIVDEVVKALENPDLAVRLLAVRLLAKFKDQRYIKRIESLTGDESDEMRAAACECLGSFGKRDVVKTLSICLKDRFWLVRTQAIIAFSKILGPECIQEIISLIRDSSWSVIETVKATMVRHVEASLPYIEKFLYEEDEIAKKTSVEVLEISGYITKILKDILSGTSDEKKYAVRLLKGIIKSQVHFGLESALENLEDGLRVKILEIIEDVNGPMAGHMQKKIHGEIIE